jgi:hypothetical protein
MSSFPERKGPIHVNWGLLVVALLTIGGMALLITGSWMLYDGQNGIVVDHNNPYIHFSETTAAQEVTDGTIALILGVACFVAFTVLLLVKRNFLFPPEKPVHRE